MVITESSVDLPVDGGTMRTLVLRPRAPGRYPALVAYSDIFQLTPSTRRALARFAGHGFVVAAPEIYHRLEPAGEAFRFDDPGRERGLANAAKTTVASWDRDRDALVDALRTRDDVEPEHIGAVGWCIGGHLAFRAALNPHVRATVCYYPTGVESGKLGSEADCGTLARAREIRGEMLLVFGLQDTHLPAAGRATIAQALGEAGTRFAVREYDAEHAFMRDEGPRYDPAATDAAFADALALYARAL